MKRRRKVVLSGKKMVLRGKSISNKHYLFMWILFHLNIKILKYIDIELIINNIKLLVKIHLETLLLTI